MSSNGWICQVCQQWINPGTVHYCGGQPSSPGATPFAAGCRAPWSPLTPEMIRLIVREELERRFPPGKSGDSEKP